MAGIAGADELNDRTRFRGFYRTDASSEFVGHAVAEMARQFNWTQMAIISRSESLFTMVCGSYSNYNNLYCQACFIADCREFKFNF